MNNIPNIPIELEEDEFLFNEETGDWELGELSINNMQTSIVKKDTPIVIPDNIPIIHYGNEQYITIYAASSVLNLSFQRAYFKIKKYNIPCLQNSFISSKLINIKHLKQLK